MGFGDVRARTGTLREYFTHTDWYPLDCSERSEGGRTAKSKFDLAMSEASALYVEEMSPFRGLQPKGGNMQGLLASRSTQSHAAFLVNTEVLGNISALVEEKRQAHVESTVFGVAVARPAVGVLEGSAWPPCEYHKRYRETGTSADQSVSYTSVVDVMGHLARDFEVEGGEARQLAHMLYGDVVALVLKALSRLMNERCVSGGQVELRVLVPGVGVGGLLFRVREAVANLLAPDGCDAEVTLVGTECSPSMLASLVWVADWHEKGSRLSIHPWLWHRGNMLMVGDQYQQVLIAPTTQPLGAPYAVVVAADVFADGWGETKRAFGAWVSQSPTYQDSDVALQFDVVLTSYVVDAVTSSGGVTRTLDRIAELLRPDGVWVNFGPLQYHSPSLHPKLSAEEIVAYMGDLHGMVADRPLSSFIAGAIPYSTPPTIGLMDSRHRSLLFSMARRRE